MKTHYGQCIPEHQRAPEHDFFSYITTTSNESQKTGSHSHRHHHLWKYGPKSPFLWGATSLPNLIYLTKYCKDHISMAFLFFFYNFENDQYLKMFSVIPISKFLFSKFYYIVSQIERNKILLDSLNRIHDTMCVILGKSWWIGISSSLVCCFTNSSRQEEEEEE
jgi:hypothetical protein